MIHLTDNASKKIREMAFQRQMDHANVRLMVIGGGCSGLSYDMDFEEAPREGDAVFEQDGVKVFVDPMTLGYLEGKRVDFVETFTHAGFQFDNPNAQKGCGCGKSFTV